MAVYLDFEKNIKKIEDDIVLAKTKADEHAVKILHKKLQQEVEKTFSNLTDYQKLKLARHPDRPYALDYIRALLKNSVELHGDRHFKDDWAIVCFMGTIGDIKCIVIGEQKGRSIQNKKKRNFGMPNPEGYRKALRVAKLAEKFNLPILFLVDTPGAYPGIGAEQRSQSEAIARNLLELSDLDTIIIPVVIGEGGSGGALAISIGDVLSMMRYSVYSVISPEGCASILWKDQAMVETATNALQITADKLKNYGLIDDIIDEPLIGAHRDKDSAIKNLGDYFIEKVKELKLLSKEQRLNRRYERLIKLGSFSEDDEKSSKENDES